MLRPGRRRPVAHPGSGIRSHDPMVQGNCVTFTPSSRAFCMAHAIHNNQQLAHYVKWRVSTRAAA